MQDLFKTWVVETPIAHRGFHNDSFPENSLSAFKNAIAHGYAIELDVQMLSDDTVVVFHDESLSRMTGNDGYLKFLTKQDLPFLKLKGSKETIPTLNEALKTINGKTPIIIEIKNNSNEKMMLDGLQNTNTVYLEDNNEQKYYWQNHEILEEDISIGKLQKKQIEIKFNKEYRPKSETIKINFFNIILGDIILEMEILL